MPDVPQQELDVPQEPDVKIEEEVEEPSSEKSKLFINIKNYCYNLLSFFSEPNREKKVKDKEAVPVLA